MSDQVKDNDDVFEFLESLGPDPNGSSTGPAETPTGTNQPNEKELLGYLDELTQEAATPVAPATPDIPAIEASINTRQSIESPSKPKSEVELEAERKSTSSPLPKDAVASLTSWLGSSGIWDSASAAVKGAEAKVQDLQNLDRKSWEEKVKGNIGGLNSKFGISKTLASTFSSVLQTIVPPILRHEQLRIHIFHDIVGYPSIDTLVYSVFDRVMQQVEGGELMIVQKGRESRKRDSDKKGVKRDMGLFTGGLEAGEKLAKANIEQIRLKGKEPENLEDQDSPIRKSDIYLSIQAVSYSANAVSSDVNPESESQDKLFAFIIYLSDPFHDLSFTTHSQSFPLLWCDWLDSEDPIPGQVDPREWLAEWVEEGLGLAIGVVAQRYVASRLAIGVNAE
ncbi:maintenance of telomere capping protein 1 [Lipomyces arxii]|uniref:maintenance of telomere capping protein 1 n=1 Tax=Lipomyces arxii TaxID=56418 RepID=UPI0034CF814A